eukprot:8720502-Ditylum_brightwellii.AAC.1
MIAVPTDKTNSYSIVTTAKYRQWVETHLQKNADEIPWQEVVRILHAAKLFVEDLEEELSKGEMSFLSEGVASKAISNLNYWSRITRRGMKKMDNKTIQKMLDDAGAIYSKHTIIQALDLKKKLEALELSK